jgi:hypothetical protein
MMVTSWVNGSEDTVSPSAFFEWLGAPLVNIRWSWGAVRSVDNAVFLRVWQDECKRVNGHFCVKVGYVDRAELGDGNHGRNERREHLALIRHGAPSYLIMCRAEDPTAVPRTVKGFNASEIFVGGRVVETEDTLWLEVIGREDAARARIRRGS